RVCIVLPLLVALPWLLPVAEGGTEVRALSLTLSDPGNLSGRDLLWPYFEELASKSPWIGWGVGAGNVAVPPESGIIRLMHTWAAHNEYLRIEVEGGLIGSILLFALFTLWAWRHSAPLRQSDRVVIRLVFIAFACHAYTDNVLISSSACVLFTFVSAVFALGRESKPLLINSARCA
ncbi:MAG: O-antigen ligase family protein, partial [Acetobacteraceae bacterium]|nr:O-antigen ligase family protein [Acetobacteraceae bacterium]